MIKRWLHGMRLSLMLSLVVLIIFLITSMIVVMIAFVAMHLGWMDKLGLRRTFPIMVGVLPASAIVGTLVTLIFGRIPLRPIREMIDATNRLAAGDFSARLTLKHRPEFRALQESFNRMAEELNSIELLRGDFVNNFSHEFKTPIVSIKGFAELLKADDLPREEREEYLDIIIRESTRLASMATNVLNLSRFENQTIVADKQNYNVSEQVRRCILMLESAWEQRNLQLEIDLAEVEICANEEMMSQVWLNLLDNAIKFSGDGGRIVVTLRAAGAVAVAAVRDYGPGIEAKDIAHVFDKFYQADPSRAIPGNGLGLTLARRIVQLHGGSITCESEPGHWTEFTVSLPIASGCVVQTDPKALAASASV
ncbi:MAG TPA: HAMP domain-containing sensor histidine kinase [Candidatus Limiplasma sp.]|nr:HAMP domain-containing sensor histidine kinase [Candidatus Limiplasma sp.]HPS82333.1 HAMP domain-containing sensor histidine kinase [Candidatus Limiplasma sp.]